MPQPPAALDDVVVVGNFSDDPFAIDVAFGMGQAEDIADLISIKTFANSEFCPRFINDEQDLTAIGAQLDDKTVIIVSTTNRVMSRNNLAMRNLLIARAAKDNGAAQVVLVEPDLFYSAQDRGPRPRARNDDVHPRPARLQEVRWAAVLGQTLRRTAPAGRGRSGGDGAQPLRLGPGRVPTRLRRPVPQPDPLRRLPRLSAGIEHRRLRTHGGGSRSVRSRPGGSGVS